MTEWRIFNVEEWIDESLRASADSKGNGLEGELRERRREDSLRPNEALADQLRRMRGELRDRHSRFSDSAGLIREDRDGRG